MLCHDNMSRLASEVGELLNNETVHIITSDGKLLVGTLKGVDRDSNVIIDETYEKILSLDGVDSHNLGLCVIRSENVAIISQTEVDWDNCKAKPLKPVVH